jgi:hypothetical protein
MLTTHLHFSAKVKNEWSYTSIPPVYLHGEYKDKLIFTFTVCYLSPESSLIRLGQPAIRLPNLSYFSRLDFRGVSLSSLEVHLPLSHCIAPYEISRHEPLIQEGQIFLSCDAT